MKLLLPPLLPLLPLLALTAAGLLLLNKRPRLGRGMVWASLGLLAALSAPVVGNGLVGLLEPLTTDPLARPADAIVVLGAGTYFDAPEYGGDTVNRFALERLRYAAFLQRKNAKPILVTGGDPLGNGTSEAAQMKAVLAAEWQLPVEWAEDTSADTLENARNSYAILSAAGIRRIYLVTHAWHMPRARFAFEWAGFEVVPAPTHFATRFNLTVGGFVPSSEGLERSSIFCREVLGMIWYRFRLM